MKLSSLYFTLSVECCLGIVLSPLENNDNLKHITKKFVAEWQWESWPIKKELNAQANQSPGSRINVAFWKEPSSLTWYLFGGKPADSNITKVYSDIWKYSVETRVWEKFYPHPSAIKSQGGGKTGGMMSFRSDFLNEITESKQQSRNLKIYLCGLISKVNVTKPNNPDFWSTFYKRRKPDKKKKESLEILAVYVPRSSKLSKIWQINVKNNLWTSCSCCCDAKDSSKSFRSAVQKLMQENENWGENFNVQKNISLAHNESSMIFDSNINKLEDEVDNMQEHLNIKNLNKKKKINQYKKGAESLRVITKFQRKRNINKLEKKSNETKSDKVGGDKAENLVNKRKYSKENYTNNWNKEELSMKLNDEQSNRGKKEDVEKLKNSKTKGKCCPEILKSDEPVTWCDGENGALITADIGSSQIILWMFSLRTSHWTKMKVKFSERDHWSLCSDMNTVRFAEAGEEVYLICTPRDKPGDALTSSKNSTEPLGHSQKDNFVKKLVFRINYKTQILDSLGEIRLNSYFRTSDGEAVWQNTSKSILQAVKNSMNETILVLAYSNVVDLWILAEHSQTKEYFDLTEKIWRGSALKWFNKYNAALYNFQFVSESGEVETVLIQNPRIIPAGEYWKRERGRFIIRIFKNENLKNQSFENRTREQNLTYELLQSDRKPSNVESQFSHTYTYFIFFGIILAIFKVVIFVIFVKKLVEKLRQSKIRGECQKSPLIIRYSVIPDDLLQPVTLG